MWMTALLAAALAWPALAVALGLLGGRLLRRAEAQKAPPRAVRPTATAPRIRLVRLTQALASAGSRR